MVKSLLHFHHFLKKHDGHGYKLIAGTCIGFLIGFTVVIISGRPLVFDHFWFFLFGFIMLLLAQLFVYHVLAENEDLKKELHKAKHEARHYEHYKNELLAEHQHLYKDWKRLKAKERSDE